MSEAPYRSAPRAPLRRRRAPRDWLTPPVVLASVLAWSVTHSVRRAQRAKLVASSLDVADDYWLIAATGSLVELVLVATAVALLTFGAPRAPSPLSTAAAAIGAVGCLSTLFVAPASAVALLQLAAAALFAVVWALGKKLR